MSYRFIGIATKFTQVFNIQVIVFCIGLLSDAFKYTLRLHLFDQNTVKSTIF